MLDLEMRHNVRKRTLSTSISIARETFIYTYQIERIVGFLLP